MVGRSSFFARRFFDVYQLARSQNSVPPFQHDDCFCKFAPRSSKDWAGLRKIGGGNNNGKVNARAGILRVACGLSL